MLFPVLWCEDDVRSVPVSPSIFRGSQRTSAWSWFISLWCWTQECLFERQPQQWQQLVFRDTSDERCCGQGLFSGRSCYLTIFKVSHLSSLLLFILFFKHLNGSLTLRKLMLRDELEKLSLNFSFILFAYYFSPLREFLMNCFSIKEKSNSVPLSKTYS